MKLEKLFERHNQRVQRYADRASTYDSILGYSKRGKCLPYFNWHSWRHMWEEGCMLYHSVPVLRSIVEKMVSYVVSDKVTYSVAIDPAFRGQVSEEALRNIKQIVSVVTRDSSWHEMQEQSIRRKFRDGEYFRWWAMENGRMKVRFIEPPEVRPNTEDASRMIELFPFGINYRIITDEIPDYTMPETYSYLPADGEEGKDFDTIPARFVQHKKFGVDSNDPRGIPLGWIAWCEINKLQEVNEAMCELAITQSSFAAVRTYKENVRNEVIDAISRGEQNKREHENNGRPMPGQVIDAKGFDLDLPGGSIQGSQFVDIIAQQFRIIGGLLDMPEHVASHEADTGNRSSLISAEGPFDRRVRREQTELGEADVDLLWEAIASSLRNTATIRFLRDAVIISPKFQSAVARDPDAQVDSQIKLVASALQSREGAIATVVGDPDVVKNQIEREQRDRVSIELEPFLTPEQRAGLNRQDTTDTME